MTLIFVLLTICLTSWGRDGLKFWDDLPSLTNFWLDYDVIWLVCSSLVLKAFFSWFIKAIVASLGLNFC